MPPEASASALGRQRRIGLRVALAVAAGLTLGMATGAVIPFLGPLFAAQFLLAGKPLPFGKAAGMVGLVLVVGQTFVLLTGLFGDRPLQLLTLLGLFYLICFAAHAQGKGGPAIFLSLVIAIMVPLLDLLHGDLDEGMMAILLQGVVSGIVLSWLAHALLPDREAETEEPAPVVALGNPLLRAVASTAILLGAVTLCLTHSGFSSAIVVPITVASLLLQLDLANSARAAFGLVAVNLLGGVLASLAFAFMELRPALPMLFLVTLFVGLILGGRAAVSSPSAKVYGGALTTFLILFGTGLSPLPGSTAESFATRIGFVLFAIAYALCMTALLWARPRTATSSA
ncbi:DUF2955 domain-containing protein [Bosea caraganae]|uniref:DUF2955 domain-containing protein n=1 Tax=Bosea caraganae TaxID=2763117 RepID=A0A370LC07_9HYPH|nr:DUF2955 domain-containing protein [Bosea caraganae]RDJ27402.1 DUF2955 domain-containing protein [Bosea caraganae]RDJ29418.1 DUF2955 domain-containing protein [Bosea caraganae]